MRGINKLAINTEGRNPLPAKRVRARTKKYLKMMHQREIDAMVEIARNQLMDHYDG